MKGNVEIYTDGSCHGNPGPGGYAAVLRDFKTTIEVSGSEWYTTNNRMELTAVVEGLKLVSGPSNVTIVTDSKYVADLINRKDLKSFIRDPKKKNTDLLRKIVELSQKHRTVTAKWVKGHAGNKLNERCDTLANAEVNRLERERDIRRFVIAAILKDVLITPEAIAEQYPGKASIGLIRKYYDQYFKMQEECYVTGRQE